MENQINKQSENISQGDKEPEAEGAQTPKAIEVKV